MTQSSMAVALAGLSFMMTMIWGPPLLRVLRYFKVGKAIRVDGPERHFAKLGTPTMGGVLIVIPVVIITVLMNASSLFGFAFLGRSVILPMGAMIAFATLGAVDDWAGLRGERKAKGMRARTKFLFQSIFAVVIAIALKYLLGSPDIFIPGVPFSIQSWCAVYSDCCICDRCLLECDQSYRWSGWTCWINCCHSICNLRRDCPPAGADLSGSILLHRCWCDLWISLV